MTSLPGTEAEPLTPEQEAQLRRDFYVEGRWPRTGAIPRLLATLDRDRARPDASLDEAWAEAGAALPKGWRLSVSTNAPEYGATAWSPDPAEQYAVGRDGPTPAAALQALTAALKARP